MYSSGFLKVDISSINIHTIRTYLKRFTQLSCLHNEQTAYCTSLWNIYIGRHSSYELSTEIRTQAEMYIPTLKRVVKFFFFQTEIRHSVSKACLIHCIQSRYIVNRKYIDLRGNGITLWNCLSYALFQELSCSLC